MPLARNRYLLGFACAALILAMVGVAIMTATQRFRSDAHRVAHTLLVITSVDRINSDLLRGIGMQRSYLLTGDTAYRDIYTAARQGVRSDLASLLALVDDNPAQQGRVRQLGMRIEARMDLAQEGIRLYDSAGFGAARSYARTNRSLEVSQGIEQQMAAIRRAEESLLQVRQRDAERSAQILYGLGLLGIPLSLAILFWIYVLLSREVRQRAGTQAQADALNQKLEHSISGLERAGSELRELSHYAGLLQSCRNIPEALDVTRRTLITLLPECAGSVYMLRASQDYAEIEIAWGEHAVQPHSLLMPQECWALRRATPYCVDDIGEGMACGHIDAPPAGMVIATACLPLTAQGMNLGFLYLSSPTRGPLPRLTLATAAAEQLSLALSNLHLQETLRQQSIRDMLSGLYNRRYLEESLTRELARCERRNLPLALLMLDLDRFKALNDVHGHDAGDAALAAFGHLLQASCRSEDIPCRYGGEEFVLILPETDLDTAQRRAEQIRAAVEQLRVRHLQQDITGMTVSIGVSIFPIHARDPVELKRCADAALYRAKHGGRNRVEVASPG